MAQTTIYYQDSVGIAYNRVVVTTNDDAQLIVIYPSDAFDLVGNSLVPKAGYTLLTEAVGAPLFQQQQDVYEQMIRDSFLL
jgi:hypothetical protein